MILYRVDRDDCGVCWVEATEANDDHVNIDGMLYARRGLKRCYYDTFAKAKEHAVDIAGVRVDEAGAKLKGAWDKYHSAVTMREESIAGSKKALAE